MYKVTVYFNISEENTYGDFPCLLKVTIARNENGSIYQRDG